MIYDFLKLIKKYDFKDTKRFLLILLYLIPTGCYQMKEILFLGDSLTYGYLVSWKDAFPNRIQEKLEKDNFKNYTVINAGVPGDTTEMAYYRLEYLIKGYSQLYLLVVFLGANDYLQGIPPEITYKYYKNIIEKVQSITQNMIIIEFLPFTGKVDSYKNIFIRLKKEYPFLVVVPEFFSEILKKPELLLEDQLHPNEKGYQIIADKIYPYLKKILKKDTSRNQKSLY
ncbi:MAG: GDSL-type esterase/lipase family protein [Leptonema sp. (in: bacteria)]